MFGMGVTPVIVVWYVSVWFGRDVCLSCLYFLVCTGHLPKYCRCGHRRAMKEPEHRLCQLPPDDKDVYENRDEDGD